MSTVEKHHKATIQEYLAYDEAFEGRAEYYDGEIFDMAGGTGEHARITANALGALFNALRDSDCSAFSGDFKVEIESGKYFLYPDLSVVCGEIDYSRMRRDVFKNPVVIFEVLSASTAAFDRAGKFNRYRQIPSLQEYVLIEQSAPQVDVFYKTSEGQWLFFSYTDMEAMVHLQSLNARIAMADIYRKVEFEGMAYPVAPVS